MKMNIERNINIALILALGLISVSTSPEAINQLVAFVSLLAVVFGRDILLKKLNTRDRKDATA